MSTPVTGLSKELEELMVEGLLLPVSLPEVQTLYHVLLDRVAIQHTNRCMSQPQDDSTDCDKHMQSNSQGNNMPLNEVYNHATDGIVEDGEVNSIGFQLCCFCLQDGIGGSRDIEKKAKRHLEKEALAVDHRGKDKKHSPKKRKMNKEKNQQRRAASTSPSPRSDFSQSDDSDEEMAMCPAERCQLPEGDEVRNMREKCQKMKLNRL